MGLWGYRGLQELTRGDRGLLEVAGGYWRLQGVTRGCGGLQEVTGGYRRLQEVTGGYLSNRPHFLWVYRRDNPPGMLVEREKSFGS